MAFSVQLFMTLITMIDANTALLTENNHFAIISVWMIGRLNDDWNDEAITNQSIFHCYLHIYNVSVCRLSACFHF